MVTFSFESSGGVFGASVSRQIRLHALSYIAPTSSPRSSFSALVSAVACNHKGIVEDKSESYEPLSDVQETLIRHEWMIHFSRRKPPRLTILIAILKEVVNNLLVSCAKQKE